MIGGLDPWIYHLTSLVLCAGNAVLLLMLVRALLAASEGPLGFWDRVASAVAVGLFMVHPLRTEVVAWASCQPYLLCAAFMMLAVLAYLHAHPTRAGAMGPNRPGWTIAAYGLTLAALLSKAVAITLPLVFVILDVYPLRRLGGGPGRWCGRTSWTVWAEKLPLALLAAPFVVWTIQAKAAGLTIISDAGFNAKLTQSWHSVWFYLAQTFWPVELSAFYPIPPGDVAWTAPRFFNSGLVIASITLGLILGRRLCPGLLAAWISYLVILSPNSGLVRVSNQLAADRYSYIAMSGLVVVVAVGLGRLFRRFAASPKTLAAGCAVALGLLAAEVADTRRQCRVWSDSTTLWTDAYQHGGSNVPLVRTNLGISLARDGRLDDAATHLRAALQLDASNSYIHNALGYVIFLQGRPAEALPYLEKSIELRGDEPNGAAQPGSGPGGPGTRRRGCRAVPRGAEARPPARRRPPRPRPPRSRGTTSRALGRRLDRADRLALAVRRTSFHFSTKLVKSNNNIKSNQIILNHSIFYSKRSRAHLFFMKACKRFAGSFDRTARLPGTSAVAGAPLSGFDRDDEVGQRLDRGGELGVIAADRVGFVAIARAGRPHRTRVRAEQRLGLATGFGSHVVADELEGVKGRSIRVDKRGKILVPAERMRGHDRRAVLANDPEQIGQGYPAGNLVEAGQAVNQEVPLASRNLSSREHLQPPSLCRQVAQLARLPLVVVLGNDHPVQPDLSRALNQHPRINDAIRRMT